jgi:magnesium transporter
MIRILRAGQPKFDVVDVTAPDWKLPTAAVWLDLIDPSREEELTIERALGVMVPTKEEMSEIEVSSRLYQEDGATFMTATLLHKGGGDIPAADPLTFVLVGPRLVTIRYIEPKSFPLFEAQLERQPELSTTGVNTFVNLLEAIVDRTADNLEFTSAEVETISNEIFSKRRTTNFEPILTRLGINQTANNKVRDSLVSLSRLISFAAFAGQIEDNAEAKEHLDSLQRDIQSLTDHSSYLSGNITFLLDAALGLINIDQNSIIKIFSIVTLAIMPPTLIGAIYGMNFEHMPELHWLSGYPIALVLMVVSAVVPLIWIKRKGWF